MDFWYKMPDPFGYDVVGTWTPDFDIYMALGYTAMACDGPPNWRCLHPYVFFQKPDGIYQFIAFEWYMYYYDPPIPYIAVDVYEVAIDQS
jgi:hypothetical protein